MSLIKITDEDGKVIEQECSFSFDTSYDFDTSVLDIRGALSSSAGSIYDIKKIESDKYILDGVRVYGESYGSEDDTIVYSFTAKSYEIK